MSRKLKEKNLIDKSKIIFFDFDGVIKESIDAKGEAFTEMIPSISENLKLRIKKHHELNGGISRFNKIPLYLEWSGLEGSEENIHKFSSIFSSLVFTKVIKSKFVLGSKEFLESVFQGKECVLISATPLNELKEIIITLNLSKFFRKIYGSPQSKDYAINDYLSLSKKSSSEAIFIGDSYSDYKASKICNLDFLLRKHSKNNINNSIKIKYQINDFNELL